MSGKVNHLLSGLADGAGSRQAFPSMQSVFHFPPETVEFIPADYFAPLDLGAMFPGGEGRPLEVDLGSGDGGFLVEMARRTPEHLFLGVERLLGRIRKTSRRSARANVSNVRLLRIESHYLVRYLLPPGSVSVMHVMFPDPWPKRKHHSRRLIQREFLDAVRNALAPGGELRLSTDDLPYYEQMRAVFEADPGFREERMAGGPWDPGPDYPQTDFERYFRADGLPIYRARLWKVEPSMNGEASQLPSA